MLAPSLAPSAHVAALKRTFRCLCGNPVFFENSVCLSCGSALGFEPERGRIVSLEPGTFDGSWRLSDNSSRFEYRLCANLQGPSGCNWLIPSADGDWFCRACRLNRTIPNLYHPGNRELWRKVEAAKRRLVASLLGLGLPLFSKTEDPQAGVAFDFLLPHPDSAPVVTGHEDGVVTLNLDEADDAKREFARLSMGEPYRTLLGHLRHEIGHYYWDLFIAGRQQINEFRHLFGDERLDYQQALTTYYAEGPAVDWRERFISAYSTSHPWEDWAETWAHYLHMSDAVAAAGSFGVTIAASDLFENFDETCLHPARCYLAPEFLTMVNSWISLAAFSNELTRGMGHPDFYPFVLSRSSVAKLYFVHRVIQAQAGR